MRTYVRRTARLVATGAALTGALLSVSTPALACNQPKAPISPQVTYAFYTTDIASPVGPDLAPQGYLYQDNTDYEDDQNTNRPPNTPPICQTTLLHSNPSVVVYVCKGIPADPSYTVTFTDDGDMLNSAGDVIDPIRPIEYP